MVLEGRTALTVLREAEQASDGIGMEKADSRVGTTKLFSLPEARGVAVAGGEDEKPVPEAGKDEAWAASWPGLTGGTERLWKWPEMVVGELEIGRLATCWAKSTCWMAFAMAARKVGDIGDKTDEEMDVVVDATLESSGAETDRRGIPLDSSTRERHGKLSTGSYAFLWCA